VGFEFERRVDFTPDRASEILREIPAAPGVVCLRGADEQSQPYLTRAADLRRRLRRLLGEPEAASAAEGISAEHGRPVLSKRLNLRERVRSIEWTRTGSEFESTVVLYWAARASFGPEEARRRLRLHAPFVLRMAMSNEHPRVYVTNRINRKSLEELYGPFPSRAAAERYCEAVLDLFKLRRCWEDLEVSPQHPGCAYGEMKMWSPVRARALAKSMRPRLRACGRFWRRMASRCLRSWPRSGRLRARRWTSKARRRCTSSGRR